MARNAAGKTRDCIIVGGGSAGCALANRLSADPAKTVLVLEAGRRDCWWDVLIHMPAAFAIPIGNPRYDWKYESEPEPHMNGRRIRHARGKALGGSSSINGMIFQRGNPMDYERWAADPGRGTWDYAHCLPYFKRMETCLAGGDPYRGIAGPLVLERGAAASPLFAAFFEAVQQAGHALTDEQILAWIVRDAETALHPSCTCRMGTDEMAVVDPLSMKVHGVDGLSACDASVLPHVTNGNIYAPVMMVAEKAADLIAGNAPLPPEPVAFYRHERGQEHPPPTGAPSSL